MNAARPKLVGLCAFPAKSSLCFHNLVGWLHWPKSIAKKCKTKAEAKLSLISRFKNTAAITLSSWLSAEVMRQKQSEICCKFEKERNCVSESRLVWGVLWRRQLQFVVWCGFATAEIIFQSKLETEGGTESPRAARATGTEAETGLRTSCSKLLEVFVSPIKS